MCQGHSAAFFRHLLTPDDEMLTKGAGLGLVQTANLYLILRQTGSTQRAGSGGRFNARNRCISSDDSCSGINSS